jgi:hypothetical protein
MYVTVTLFAQGQNKTHILFPTQFVRSAVLGTFIEHKLQNVHIA